MEESLKAIRALHRLVILTSAALLILFLSAKPTSNDYGKALAEFRQIKPAFEQLAALSIAEANRFYREQGVGHIFKEELGFSDTIEFNFIGDTAFHPSGGSWIPLISELSVYQEFKSRPLKNVYDYLRGVVEKRSLRVCEVDKDLLRVGLKKFSQNNHSPTPVSNIWLYTAASGTDGTWLGIIFNRGEKTETRVEVPESPYGIYMPSLKEKMIKLQAVENLLKERQLNVAGDILPALSAPFQKCL